MVLDDTKLLKTAKTQKGATYTYTYDEAGNVTSVVGSANGLDSLKSDVSYSYTSGGGTTYSVTASDQDGKTSTEVYNSQTGTLQSTTDTKGVTTTYTYDAETDLVESVSKGNQSVEYTYDAFGKLIGISHEGTTYTFGYDKFGNRTTTAVGSRVLSTNTYDSNNGKLLSTSYGNGSETAYTYDVFGNIATKSYDGTEVVRNYTDSAGNINRTQDLLTNLEHRVTYDSTGRLISKEVLDLTASGDRWLNRHCFS